MLSFFSVELLRYTTHRHTHTDVCTHMYKMTEYVMSTNVVFAPCIMYSLSHSAWWVHGLQGGFIKSIASYSNFGLCMCIRDLHFLRQDQVPLYCRNIWKFCQCGKGHHMPYVIINTGQKIWGINFSPTRPGGEIANTFLLAKISGYISVMSPGQFAGHTALPSYSYAHLFDTCKQHLESAAGLPHAFSVQI